jgi:glucose-6-phosphate isomerase
VPEVNACTVGALIALYERAVGYYASLVNINAYHQPGVEAGKKAAARILALQGKVRAALDAANGEPRTAEQLAGETGADPEDVYHVLNHLAANSSNMAPPIPEKPSRETFRIR